MVHGRRVIDRLADTAPIEADIISHPGEVDEMLAHIGAGFSNLAGFEGTLNKIAVAAGHGGDELIFTDEFLHMDLIQLWLWIEGVDMAGSTSHHQKDTSLRFSRKMRRFRL